MNKSPYAGYTKEDLENLIEWECQDMYGGRMPFAGASHCIHPECHPLNDDRVRKDFGIEEKDNE